MNERVRFVTLGCKVNQYETQAMRESVVRAGVEDVGAGLKPAPTDVDFVIINTCTVTEEADRESRYWIRRVRREHPGAKIVVTGCYAERNRKEIEALPEVDLILSNHEKADIANRLLQGCASPESQDCPTGAIPILKRSINEGDCFGPSGLAMTNASSLRGLAASQAALPEAISVIRARTTYASLSISRTEGSGRAFVKIQDGCNHACTFCKVVRVRGRSRSRPLPEIVEEIYRLRDGGYREIVFTGIQLGAYGMDFKVGAGFSATQKADLRQTADGSVLWRTSFGGKPAPTLVDVIAACSQIEGIERLRLSSIEPTDVRRDLIETLRDEPKCCPHLHIPLQSGDDSILKRMNRRYRSSFYLELVTKLRQELRDFSLTLDVMAGFPGETEEAFQNTVSLLEIIRPLKCHVFPFSPREGTPAARYEGCSKHLIQERVQTLLALSDRLGRRERSAHLGKTFSVLVEQQRGEGMLQGLTSHYLKVCFPGERDKIGEIIPVELLTLQGDLFLGRQCGADKERTYV